MVKEFGGGGYSLEDLEADMREYSRLPAPWLLLSGGLNAEQFVQMLEAALSAGARGFLAGRAVWQHPLRFYPDKARVREALREEGLETLHRLNELLQAIKPMYPEVDWRLEGVAG